MKALVVFLLAVCSLVAAPRLIYTKSFPGSQPPYVEIAVDRSGDGIYKEDPKDDDPLKFQLSSADTDQIFHLADSLGHFTQPLEAKAKVANMGMKTFRYEEGAAGTEVKSTEVRFNFSENLDAQALTDWFERMAETERAYIELERTVRFDKLGVQDAILRIEILRDQKRFTAPRQFLPLLDRVANNEGFLHIARDRAANLAEQIRAGK